MIFEVAALESFRDHLRVQRRVDAQVARVLIQAGKDAEVQILRLAADPRVGSQVRAAQLVYYRSGLQFQYDQMWRGIEGAVREGTNQAASAGLSGAEKALQALLGYSVPPEVAEGFLVASVRSGELVKARILNAIPLSQQVYRTSVLAGGWLQRSINSGLARNLSAKELAREVRRFIDPRTRGGVSYAAKRLARTEINNTFHSVTRAVNQSYPWVEGMQWRLSGSHPKADDCDDLAGKDHEGKGAGVFSPRNVPNKPHPQCLCFTVAVTVSPGRFSRTLLAGGYDNWLIQNGFAPIGLVA